MNFLQYKGKKIKLQIFYFKTIYVNSKKLIFKWTDSLEYKFKKLKLQCFELVDSQNIKSRLTIVYKWNILEN